MRIMKLHLNPERKSIVQISTDRTMAIETLCENENAAAEFIKDIDQYNFRPVDVSVDRLKEMLKMLDIDGEGPVEIAVSDDPFPMLRLRNEKSSGYIAPMIPRRTYCARLG